MTSLTKDCAPNPIATAAKAATTSAGSGLMPTCCRAVRNAIAQTTLAEPPSRNAVSARVCCSRSCSAREGPAAGLMSRLVTARKERLTNSVMPKIAKRRSAIGRADSLRKGRMLDISDWSGEYNIELAGVLAPHALRREEPFKKGAANGNIQEISFSDCGRSFRDALDRCRGWWSRSVSEAAVTHASRRRRAQFQSDSKRKVSD